MIKPELQALSTKLGYTFQNITLLELALCHRSLGKENNERLEFLGDAALNFIVATVLYQHFPEAKEGDLSRLRASLVKAESLAILATHFDLSQYLRLGHGEQRSGGASRSSIQSDAIEAIIGAIYLDSDFNTCQRVVLQWYNDMLLTLKTPQELKDPKTRLQEYLQGKKMPLPMYEISETMGEAHTQVFYIKCTVAGLPFTSIGVGSSRRRAEQDAAQKFFEVLQSTPSRSIE